MRLAWLMVLLTGSAAHAADELPGLAALNLKAQRGVDASLAELISEATLSELRAARRFKSVIGSSDVAAMISAEQQKQALGCDEDSCLAQLGGALGVPYLLTGSLGAVGGRFILNLKMLWVDEARVVERVTKVFADEAALIDGLNGAVGELTKSFQAADKGLEKSVEVMRQPEASSPKSVVLPGALVAVGLGALGASYAVVLGAQNEHNTAQSVTSGDALETAVFAGNALLYTGLGSVAAGVAVWVW